MNKKAVLHIGFKFLIGAAIGIVILMWGAISSVQLIKFFNQPVINGSIPVWVLLVIGIVVIIFLRRRKAYR